MSDWVERFEYYGYSIGAFDLNLQVLLTYILSTKNDKNRVFTKNINCVSFKHWYAEILSQLL